MKVFEQIRELVAQIRRDEQYAKGQVCHFCGRHAPIFTIVNGLAQCWQCRHSKGS